MKRCPTEHGLPGTSPVRKPVAFGEILFIPLMAAPWFDEESGEWADSHFFSKLRGTFQFAELDAMFRKAACSALRVEFADSNPDSAT